MSIKLLLCASSLALGLVAVPALSQSLERAVSSPYNGAAVASPRSGPSTGVAAGEPWLGLETVTAASLAATGARSEADATAPDQPTPELAAVLAVDGRESLINWDSRLLMQTSLYPNRAIVYITYNGQHHCTGFMISANTLATAGHCVHTGGRSGAWYNTSLFRVYPGRDGASSPYGSCGVRRSHSVNGWTRQGNSTYDYGAMRLDCSVGSTVGWFGLYSLGGSRAFAGQPAIMSGYPGDKPQTQWLSADIVRQSQTLRVCYRMDTMGGHSGSPVWNDRDAARHASGVWAFAIHTYGVGGSICDGTMNAGTRLTSARVNNFVTWINAS